MHIKPTPMFCKLVAFAFLICLSFRSAGQYYNQTPEFIKANSVWAFPQFGGLNFNGTFTAFTSQIPDRDGSASVSDKHTGDLLFYSNGQKCWNRNQTVMPNGDSLLGNGSTFPDWTVSPQGVLIVPVVDNPKKYYLFSMEAGGGWGGGRLNGRLYYSIVDMSLNNGLGDVVPGQKNILIDSALGESMLAVPGDKCERNVWLVVHTMDSAIFKSYEITAAGISASPVLSHTGNQIQGRDTTLIAGWLQVISKAYSNSFMSISPDRKLLAISARSSKVKGRLNGQLLCQFDVATGVVSNGMKIIDTVGCTGAVFSPDNSKLYALTEDRVNTAVNPSACYPSSIPGISTAFIVYQYDVSVLTAATIIASKFQVFSSCAVSGQPKLYNDKIYFPQIEYLNRINSPNLAGAACDFQYATIGLNPNAYSYLSLPADVIAWPDADTLVTKRDTFICNDSLAYTLHPDYPHNTIIVWDNGSTDSIRTIGQDGIYWVKYFDTSCNIRIDSFKVKITRDMPQDGYLGSDTVLCNTADPYTIEGPEVNGASYLWQDGSWRNSFMVRESGQYWLQISKNGCIVRDTIAFVYKDLRQDLGADTSLCRGEAINFVLTAKSPAGSTILWNTGATTQQIVANAAGMYTVTVTDFPCVGTDSINLDDQQLCECRLMMPSAFSPNGDGKNDVFGPSVEQGCVIGRYNFNIYNRWGQRVFNSIKPGRQWDGTFNGRPVDAGVYFYEISFEAGTYNKPFNKKGDLTLLR